MREADLVNPALKKIGKLLSFCNKKSCEACFRRNTP